MKYIIFIAVFVIEYAYKPRLDILSNGNWVLWYNKQKTKHTYERSFIYIFKSK